jgi:hypothetical protein
MTDYTTTKSEQGRPLSYHDGKILTVAADVHQLITRLVLNKAANRVDPEVDALVDQAQHGIRGMLIWAQHFSPEAPES